jgi:phosphoribosylformylglycinamidine cyclo-ligase
MYNPTKPYTEEILRLIASCKGNVPSSTDGIGTKGIYHWEQRTFRNAVLDSLAMNLNDMAILRAKAIGLTNHIMIPEEDEEAIYEIVRELVRECKKRNISIYSGETAIHDDYKGLEISVSVNGEYVNGERENKFEVGDILVGLRSNGLHSNGFTKVREVFGKEYRKEFTEPTIIYSDAIEQVNKKFDIHGMAHITGGAFTKLKGFIDDSTDLLITTQNSKLSPHTIFYDLYRNGIDDEEMYNTFNCGVGFILSSYSKDAERIVSEFKNLGLESDVIGAAISGLGKVKIKSAFSGKETLL